MASAEANFSALYGYDVRGEVFGSKGMVTMGDVSRSNMRLFNADGIHQDTWRMDTDLFIDGYTEEFRQFARAVRGGVQRGASAVDARRALAVALAAVKAIETGAPVSLLKVAQPA